MNLVARETAKKNAAVFSEGYYGRLTPDNVCRRLNEKLAAFDYDAKTLTVSFEINEWMLNSWNVLHGGMYAMCSDMASGALSRILYGTHAPTVTMSLSYLHAAKYPDTLYVTAYATHLGQTNAHFRTELRSKTTGGLLATGTSIHFVGGCAFTEEMEK